MSTPPPYEFQPVSADPTAVMGRRIGAGAIDFLLPSVIAIAIGVVLFFDAGTRINDVGYRFCDYVDGNAFDFRDDPLVDRYRFGYTCVQINDDAIVVSDDDTARAFGLGFLAWMFVPLNYFFLQGLTGASLGKHLFGLRVVRTTGQVAGFGWNALRTLLLLAATFLCGVVLLPAELVVAAATKRHQRVGDMAAGTYVVAKSAVGVPIAPAVAAMPTPWATAPPGPGTPSWGAPTVPPTWGTPNAPPTWGTPTQAAPPAWGAPADPPTDLPPTAAGWAAPVPPAPAPAAPVPPAPSPAAAVDLPPGAEMRFDERWNAWLYWDPAANRWLRHDAATGTWIPM